MGYRRLFIMRKDLKMSPGKLAAQVGHCAEAFWTWKLREAVCQTVSSDNCTEDVLTVRIPHDIMQEYINGTFTKTICAARSKNDLMKAKALAEELNLTEGKDFGLIYDKCLTELTPEEADGTTLTGIWFAPLPDEVSHAISKKYHLYT